MRNFNQSIQPEQVEDFLATKYQGSSQLSQRLQVFAAFANGPAGILAIDLE